MHKLPFDAQMTEKLFRMAQGSPGFPWEGTDCVRSIQWAPLLALSYAVPGNLGSEGWLLATIPRRHAEPQRVHFVDGVSFYIPANIEPLLPGQVFDWDDSKGVVSHAA